MKKGFLNHKLPIQNAFNKTVCYLTGSLRDTWIRFELLETFLFGVSFRPLPSSAPSFYCYYTRPKTIHNSYLFYNLIYLFSFLITDVIYILLLPVALFIIIRLVLNFSPVMEHCTHVLFLCAQHTHTQEYQPNSS